MILTGQIGILASTLSFVMGMVLMGNPKKAAKGNLLLVLGMLAAIVSTIIVQSDSFTELPWMNISLIAGLLAVGTLAGRKISFSFQLTKMPELVSLFNGFGGLAASLIGFVGLFAVGIEMSISNQSILLVSIFLGLMTFSASLLAYFKLGGKFRGHIKFNRSYTLLSLILSVALIVKLLLWPSADLFVATLAALVLFSFIHGFFFASAVGGGDMPILISVLNGLTGVLTVISGIYFESTIMILAGVFVGATGLILTVQMCSAMNTSLINVFVKSKTMAGATEEANQYADLTETSAARLASDLTLSKKVVIVPGFGLAVAKAQGLCRDLKDELKNLDIEVKFVIHPVAGRMPGHMNVLLAEAGIEYADILDLNKGNEYLAETDVCLVIGANDVVNTAAEDDETSSIHGMPIVKTYLATKVITIKRSLSPGYAGIKNPLFEKQQSELFFLDAKVALENVLTELKMSV